MSEPRRPRVLLITRNLPPLVGGMERLNWHLADQLSRFAEVRMIGPSGSASLAPSSVQVRESPLRPLPNFLVHAQWNRSEEHTSELQSLMRISYAVFCLKKKKPTKTQQTH